MAQGLADLKASLWAATAPSAPETPALTGERTADVVVVGGGFTGLSAALHLAEAGAETVLLEAEEPGFGASGRNNGQVIPHYIRHDPDGIVTELGEERGERLNALVAGSASLVFDLIRRHGIDCDAVQNGWIQPAHKEDRVALIERRYTQWRTRGAEVELLDRNATRAALGSPAYFASWRAATGGHVQPLSLARGLAAAAIAQGAAVHGASPVVDLSRSDGLWRVATAQGSVSAPLVILATNAYTPPRLWPALSRSFVATVTFQAATTPLDADQRAAVLPTNPAMSDTRGNLHYGRLDRDGRLVVGGGLVLRFDTRQRLLDMLVKRTRYLFPDIQAFSFDFAWSGLIANNPQRLVRLHELEPGLLAAIGYSGRGLALAVAVGREMARVAAGTATDDLALPLSPPVAIPAHGLTRRLAPAMLAWYRLKDRL